MHSSVQITTPRLTLIAITTDVIETYSKQGYPLLKHIQMYLDGLQADPSLLGWGVWYIIRTEDGQVIGDTGFKGKPDEKRAIEVGYGISPDAQRQRALHTCVGEARYA
ncbi:GNAT family N-acetyltransferase [Paenibacillus sp. N1-5-1-14]|uniref:GNAT family N-acetyltransferase n=1 Tax=Paenibacillus radicibacter TaxID=2972488 RepID=UPI0021593C02|nr:GNAT family N-acetyltransferase [Paenibacillus radicibacter]MCR8645106.1 GNAT family N-acetyltransferase [Paenibacillus radicibacter]